MNTAFDDVIVEIKKRGFHNHRREDHSAALSRGILRDLRERCEPFERDCKQDRIRNWLDVPSPAGRARKLDLVVAEPGGDTGQPDLRSLRLCVENKSVVTAHRNRTNRYDDLNDLVGLLHGFKQDTILVATVLVGTSVDVLDVPDRVKNQVSEDEFRWHVQPRLSTGDQSLWTEFPKCVSHNRPADPARTAEKFRKLPTRLHAGTHLCAFDYVFLIPVRIDNVNEPAIARKNTLGIDVDKEYQTMLERICRAYKERWHP